MDLVSKHVYYFETFDGHFLEIHRKSNAFRLDALSTYTHPISSVGRPYLQVGGFRAGPLPHDVQLAHLRVLVVHAHVTAWRASYVIRICNKIRTSLIDDDTITCSPLRSSNIPGSSRPGDTVTPFHSSLPSQQSQIPSLTRDEGRN